MMVSEHSLEWTLDCYWWFTDMDSCMQYQVSEYFARLIQRVSPKSYAQALGEVTVTQKFLENFSGDQV